MSKTKNTRAAAARDAKTKGGKSAYADAGRALPVLALVWIGLLLATAIASLCPRFTAYYAIYLAVTIGLAAGILAFLDAIYRRKQSSSHPAFKKFLGYGLVLHYAAAAMPRVDWSNGGIIGEGRVVYLFILAIICLVVGLVLFVAAGRPAAYAALGLIPDEEVRDKSLRKKRFSEHRKQGFLHGALEWADALGFAAILVISSIPSYSSSTKSLRSPWCQLSSRRTGRSRSNSRRGPGFPYRLAPSLLRFPRRGTLSPWRIRAIPRIRRSILRSTSPSSYPWSPSPP